MPAGQYDGLGAAFTQAHEGHHQEHSPEATKAGFAALFAPARKAIPAIEHEEQAERAAAPSTGAATSLPRYMTTVPSGLQPMTSFSMRPTLDDTPRDQLGPHPVAGAPATSTLPPAAAEAVPAPPPVAPVAPKQRSPATWDKELPPVAQPPMTGLPVGAPVTEPAARVAPAAAVPEPAAPAAAAEEPVRAAHAEEPAVLATLAEEPAAPAVEEPIRPGEEPLAETTPRAEDPDAEEERVLAQEAAAQESAYRDQLPEERPEVLREQEPEADEEYAPQPAFGPPPTQPTIPEVPGAEEEAAAGEEAEREWAPGARTARDSQAFSEASRYSVMSGVPATEEEGVEQVPSSAAAHESQDIRSSIVNPRGSFARDSRAVAQYLRSMDAGKPMPALPAPSEAEEPPARAEEPPSREEVAPTPVPKDRPTVLVPEQPPEPEQPEEEEEESSPYPPPAPMPAPGMRPSELFAGKGVKWEDTDWSKVRLEAARRGPRFDDFEEFLRRRRQLHPAFRMEPEEHAAAPKEAERAPAPAAAKGPAPAAAPEPAPAPAPTGPSADAAPALTSMPSVRRTTLARSSTNSSQRLFDQFMLSDDPALDTHLLSLQQLEEMHRQPSGLPVVGHEQDGTPRYAYPTYLTASAPGEAPPALRAQPGYGLEEPYVQYEPGTFYEQTPYDGTYPMDAPYHHYPAPGAGPPAALPYEPSPYAAGPEAPELLPAAGPEAPEPLPPAPSAPAEGEPPASQYEMVTIQTPSGRYVTDRRRRQGPKQGPPGMPRGGVPRLEPGMTVEPLHRLGVPQGQFDGSFPSPQDLSAHAASAPEHDESATSMDRGLPASPGRRYQAAYDGDVSMPSSRRHRPHHLQENPLFAPLGRQPRHQYSRGERPAVLTSPSSPSLNRSPRAPPASTTSGGGRRHRKHASGGSSGWAALLRSDPSEVLGRR